MYELDARTLLMVTSNRVSAYDVVFAEPVPRKGAVLNLMSAYWFDRTRHIVPNHVVETRASAIFAEGSPDAEIYRGRVMAVRRTEPIRFECVVRGHLDGSAWKEYQQNLCVCGFRLKKGLQRYDKIPETLFTPARKALEGHDENIRIDQMAAELGKKETKFLRDVSLDLYNFAYDECGSRGLTLLDTKFEFGTDPESGEVLLIDEVFTPDSSRYRPKEGEAMPLDKQYLRDALAERGFTGDGPAPALDEALLTELSARYAKAFQMITGTSLDEAMAAQG